jgi:asparagine synthase (glutamine-hydrolysing)
MCGIVGVFNTDGKPVSITTLHTMTDAIAHRGPDGEGFYTDGFVGLGHRRLAIIDLSAAGHQPMATPEGDIVLTYNGEVYNFPDLRVELQARGYQFRSRTDTEAVLYAYKEWGPRCLEKFNGMFAFAAWDRRSQTLFLARDRYGIKPLYYTHFGNTFLFASEIKAFLKHPEFRAEVSEPHMLEYFTFQNIFTDGTLFRRVKLLPAGHFLTVPLAGSSTSLTQYWDFYFAEPNDERPDAEYEEELDQYFCRAVQRQLVSDVPVGSYLSGGIDSGSITAIAAGHLPYLKTFTCGFDLTSASGIELGYDERQKAEALSYLLKTEHYEVILKAGDMERCLPDLIWHLEDLRVGQSYPNYYVARLASKFVKVVLCGMGGDELFAGYPWRYYRAVVNDDFDHYIEKYHRFWHRLVSDQHMPELFLPKIWNRVKDVRTIDIFRSVLEGQGGPPKTPEEYVNRSLHLEAKTFLQGLFLVEDKLSMAHGLETRVPFLDNDLVELAMRMPVRLKLKDLENVVKLNENEPGLKTQRYFYQTRDGKLILRQAMGRHIPEKVTDQVKQGFAAPDASWFKGDSIDYVRSILYDKRARIYDFFEPKTVQSLVAEHLSGKTNRRLFIWSLLCFEWWLRKFVG